MSQADPPKPRQAWLISIAAVVAALIGWEAVARVMNTPQQMPPLKAIAEAFAAMLLSGELGRATGESLKRVAVGYVWGAGAGIVAGLLLGSIRAFNDTVGLVMEFIKGIPPIAVAPLAIMWLGVGEGSKYLIIGYIVCIVVAVSTAVGAAEVPIVRLRAGAIFGLGWLRTFTSIILPSSMPFIMAGLRSAIGFAFVALVSAELIAANSGIGQIIMDARFALQTSTMIVGLLTLGAVGALIQVAFDALVRFSVIGRRYH